MSHDVIMHHRVLTMLESSLLQMHALAKLHGNPMTMLRPR